MNKIIFYTQRVSIVESYNERRDCADQMIPVFLSRCGYIPMPVPNVPNIIEEILKNVEPSGVFLSGGNSLCKYGGDAPERDEVEKFIVNWAINRNLPILGICRGMQFLADYFGADLKKIENHVGIRHAVIGLINRESVNSYHTFGIFNLLDDIKILGRAPDGSIEAFEHKTLNISAIGWHPERENNFSIDDINLVNKIFK